MAIFCFLNNFLYKTDYDEEGNYKYLEQENFKEEEQKLQEQLKKYNKENQSEVTMYITIKTKLDIMEQKRNFSNTSWQYHKINDYLYETLYQLNYYKYIEKDITKYDATEQEYQTILTKLQEDNWQYFLKIDKANLEKLTKELMEQLEQTSDKKEKLALEEQINETEFNLQILNYRIQNSIKEDSSYLNVALENYQENYKLVEYYQNNKLKRTHQEELEYRTALSKLKINQYIIEHQQNINQQNNLNNQLRTIIEDYEIFFVVLILILSGTIICDEFKDGTIKLLLIKPYSRCKILLGKYFAVITIMTISILGSIMFQLLVGGIMFGFASLKMPVVIYHFNKSKMIELSIFQYMGIRILTRVPFLLILISMAMIISVISSNSIFSITLPLMLYMFSPALKKLTIQYQLTFMKYLVNINWDLQEYLFGNLSEVPFISLPFSLTILIIYFIVLWILTFQIFKKKNIKNI